ncbi:1067_t:CDS:10 [Entrophospora sp. SA101]|nr:1067_t:CDS:10 [Entrophospora sp. SA101]
MDFPPSYHPREDSDNDYLPASDSDSDIRSPKRLRIDILERETNMRIGQIGNGVGEENTTNGRSSTTTNGNLQSSTNGQFSTNNGLQGIRRREIVRLMVQAMQGMGYNQAATTLENESGFPLESKDVARFKDGVLKGDWTLVESLLPTLELDNSKDAIVKFLIREQKFLELLESSQLKMALFVLRTELTPLDFNLDRVHVLSSYIMYSNAEDLRFHSEWDGAKGTSRQKLLLELQRYISPSIMVPEHRLETLLEQSITLQRISCLYHNTDQYISLYSDHAFTTHIFNRHTDEVWYVAFSNNGRFLASASRDKTAIIWSLETLDVVHTLREHTDCVSFLSWSPDDSNLLTCGQDNKLKLWNVESGKCLKTMHKHVDPVTTCAWLPDVLYGWSGVRIMDLVINKDGTRMAAICHDKKIHIYDLISKKEEATMDESANVTSICLSNDCRYALVNLSTEKIHLWDIEERRLVKKYYGQKQGKFVIRSCFGGIDQGFIVSGSEDSKIYVWHREHATLIEALPGHKGTVNSVNWSPVNSYMFASAGDDHTIRIWGIPNAAG